MARHNFAGPVAVSPGRAQILSPSQPRRLGCRLFRSVRGPCGATRFYASSASLLEDMLKSWK